MAVIKLNRRIMGSIYDSFQKEYVSSLRGLYLITVLTAGLLVLSSLVWMVFWYLQNSLALVIGSLIFLESMLFMLLLSLWFLCIYGETQFIFQSRIVRTYCSLRGLSDSYVTREGLAAIFWKLYDFILRQMYFNTLRGALRSLVDEAKEIRLDDVNLISVLLPEFENNTSGPSLKKFYTNLAEYIRESKFIRFIQEFQIYQKKLDIIDKKPKIKQLFPSYSDVVRIYEKIISVWNGFPELLKLILKIVLFFGGVGFFLRAPVVGELMRDGGAFIASVGLSFLGLKP